MVDFCDDCPLASIATHPVPGIGQGRISVMFVGEAPGEDEDKEGKPFVGRAGKDVFNPMLKQLGLKRDDVWIYNVLRCRPPDNQITSLEGRRALALCPGRFLYPAIAELQPKVIVALGATAGKILSNGNNLRDMRGRVFTFGKSLVLVTFHPASVLPNRKPGNYSTMYEDVRRALYLVDNYRPIRERYHVLIERGELDDFFERIFRSRIGRLVYDVEAQLMGDDVNVFKDQILGIGLCWKPGHAVYIPLRHRPPFSYSLLPFWGDYQGRVIKYIRDLLESNVPKGGQNAKYDNKILLNDLRIRVENYVFDTMLASHLIDENRLSHRLNEQVRIYMPDKSGWKGEVDYKDMAGMMIQDIGNYCNTDVDVTRRLWDYYADCRFKDMPELEELMHTCSMPLQRVFQDMELIGAPIDMEQLPAVSAGMESKLRELELDMRKQFGRIVNVDSDHDVLRALAEEGVDLSLLQVYLPSGKPELDDKGNPVYTTGRAYLEAIADRSPIASLVLDTRAVYKLHNTYVLPLFRMVENGRVHGNFLVTGTVTGRPASRDPNLLNIPRGGSDKANLRHVWGKRVKGLFCAPRGWQLVQGDYSQMEVFVLAHYSGDQALKNACVTADVHLQTACDMYDLDFNKAYEALKQGDRRVIDKRQVAKSITFAIIYGSSAESIANLFHIELPLVQSFIKQYFRVYAGVKRWIERVHRQIMRDGYVVSVFGRYRRIPYANQRGKQNLAKRQAVNSLIQGTAADICIRALIRLHGQLPAYGLKARPILTVYDSIIVESPINEVPKVVDLMRREMSMKPLPDFDIPLRVDIEVGQRWSELHTYKEVS